jgi:hypothetical protein
MGFDYRGIYLLAASYGIACPTKATITDQLVGAMGGLLAWRFMTPQSRAAWDAVCSNAAFTVKPSGNTFESSTYFQLWQLRKRAFPDTNFKGISLDLLVQYPWTLTNSEFSACLVAINAGNFPQLTTAKPTDWDGEYAFAASIASSILTFLATKAPQFSAKAVMSLGYVGAAVVLASAAHTGYQKLEIAALKGVYQTDQQRRAYVNYQKTFV